MKICRSCGATRNETPVEMCCESPDILDVIELTNEKFSELRSAKEKTKSAKVTEDKLVAEIKSVYAKYGIKKILSSVATVSVSTTSTASLNEVLLIEKLKEMLTEDQIDGYCPFIKTETLNPEILQLMIKDGVVPVSIIQECTTYSKPVTKCTVNTPKVGGPGI